MRRVQLGSYTYKTQRTRGGRRLHPNARRVTTTGFERNLAFPNVPATMRRITPAFFGGKVSLTVDSETDRYGVPVRWAAWLGQRLSAGSYGVTFKLVNSGDAAQRLNAARRAATFLMDQKAPRAGATVIIKVANDYNDRRQPVPQGQADEFALASVKESSWHKFLDNAPCIRVPGVTTDTCPAAHVPDFYWAGMVVDALTSRRFYLTVMSVAPGITVNEYLNRRRAPLTAKMYLAIERAVTLMWLNGVVHADFHKGNQLYDPATGKLTIIDFGQGVGLPDAMVQKVRQAVAPAVARGVRSLGELWHNPDKSPVGVGLQAYTDKVRHTRNRAPWYNPDGHALMQMYKLLSGTERAAVPLRRRELWGVGSSALRPTQAQATTGVTTAAAARVGSGGKAGRAWGGKAGRAGSRGGSRGGRAFSRGGTRASAASRRKQELLRAAMGVRLPSRKASGGGLGRGLGRLAGVTRVSGGGLGGGGLTRLGGVTRVSGGSRRATLMRAALAAKLKSRLTNARRLNGTAPMSIVGPSSRSGRNAAVPMSLG